MELQQRRASHHRLKHRPVNRGSHPARGAIAGDARGFARQISRLLVRRPTMSHGSRMPRQEEKAQGSDRRDRYHLIAADLQGTRGTVVYKSIPSWAQDIHECSERRPRAVTHLQRLRRRRMVRAHAVVQLVQHHAGQILSGCSDRSISPAFARTSAPQLHASNC